MNKILLFFKNKLVKFLKSKIFFHCLIFIILVAALLLRLKIINMQAVTLIEAFTLIDIITKPTIIGMIKADNSIPPLQYLIVRFISWFSTELFWLRMPNLIFFTVIFFIIFDLTIKQGKLLSFIAIVLLSFSPYQLRYSWESYVYLLFQFWGAVNLYVFHKLVTEKLKKNKFLFWSILFVVSNVCGFFTHYSYVWFILAEIFYLVFLFFQERFRKIKINVKYKKIFILVLITSFILILYLPIFNSIYHAALVNISWFKRLYVLDVGHVFLTTFGIYDLWRYGINSQPYIKWVGLVFFLLFIAVNILRLKKFQKDDLINDLGFFLSLSSIVLVFFVSRMIGQSILEKKTLVIFSLIGTIYLAKIIHCGLRQKISIEILTLCFSSLLLLNYMKQSRVYANNQFYAEQRTNLNLAKIIKQENISALLFLQAGSCEISLDNNEVINREIDYYWYGYDNSFSKPPYTFITEENFQEFYQKKNYWIIGYGCDSQKIESAVSQCLSVGKQYIVKSNGLLIECINEVDNNKNLIYNE